MRRSIKLTRLATLALFGVSLLMLAQKSQDPSPYPSQVLGPQLIVWSNQQKPEPLPQLPQDLSSSPQAEPSVQTFKGRIIKDGGKFVLRVSDKSIYDLDDQQKAKR